jgi:hypothetical protein
MPFALDPVDQQKVSAARRLSGLSVGELVAVHWPAPTGTIYYAQMKYDELPEYGGLVLPDAGRIEARFETKQFQPFQISSTVADAQMLLNFVDDDGEIARLCSLHGEGVKVVLWHYYPEVDLLIQRGWFGQLGTPNETGGPLTPVPATFGFRSSQLSLPTRPCGAGCPWMFGGAITDPDMLAENGCRYNRHLGGAHGNLDADGNPYKVCEKTRDACLRIIGDTLEYGGGDTAVDTITVHETQGGDRQATTQGNESNLTSTRRVIAGEWTIRDMNVLAFLAEPDTKHPDKGSAHVLAEAGEGPFDSLTEPTINQTYIQSMHLNIRLGTYRQPPTSFSANVNNYSYTALFNGVIQGNFVGATAASFQCTVKARGFNLVKVYAEDGTFVRQWTDSPTWWIKELLTNVRFGDGRDPARHIISDWLACAAWHAALAGFSDASGAQYSSTRATFGAEITERSTQQIIKDACAASFLTLPFPFQGKERIMPLRKEDLTDVPVFTDDLDLLASDQTVRPILFDEQGSTLRHSKVKPEGEQTNYLTVNFYDKDHDYIKRPLLFQDEAAMLAAGQAAGERSIRRIRDEVTLFGVVDFGQAVRCANRYLDLGQLDAGGLKNNRKANFRASWLETLDVHPFKVIKIVSWKFKALEETYTGENGQPTLYHDDAGRPYLYFRVQTLDNDTDLTVKLMAVLYPPDYFDHLEDTEQAPERPGTPLDPNPGGGPIDRPFPVIFRTLGHTNDTIHFEMMQP